MREFEQIKEITLAAGKLALSFFGNIEREEKSIGNLVTEADRSVEKYLKNEIAKLYPNDSFLGEEFGSILGSTNRIWIIDPIDGTADFANNLPGWGISIALFEDSKPILGIVYLPVLNKFYHSTNTSAAYCNDKAIQQRFGDFNIGNYFATNASSIVYYDWTINLRVCNAPCAPAPCLVADGSVLGAFLMPAYIWDIAACYLIGTQSQINFEYLSGNQLDLDYLLLGNKMPEPLLCGNDKFINYARKNIKKRN